MKTFLFLLICFAAFSLVYFLIKLVTPKKIFDENDMQNAFDAGIHFREIILYNYTNTDKEEEIDFNEWLKRYTK